jgi:hypothetical protein
MYLSVYLSLPFTLYISLFHSLPFSLSLSVFLSVSVCLCLKFFLGCPIWHPHFVIFVYVCVIAYINPVYGTGVRTHDLSLSFGLPLSLLNYLSNVCELKSRLQNSQANVRSLSHIPFLFSTHSNLSVNGAWKIGNLLKFALLHLPGILIVKLYFNIEVKNLINQFLYI